MTGELVKVDAIVVGERDREDMGDIAALAASIADVGLLHPVVVTAGLELVAGGRRLAAVQQLGWQRVPVTFVDLATAEAALRAELDENVQRKPLTPTEALAARDRRAKVLAPLAEERKADGQRAGALGSKLDPSAAVKTRKLAAVGTGYSGSTLDKVEKIRDAATSDTVRHAGHVMPVPEPVREIAREALADVSKTGAAVDRAHRDVVKAIERHVPVSHEQRAAKWQANFLQACRAVAGVTSFPVEQIAEMADADCLAVLDEAAAALVRHAAEVKRSTSGLRLVTGGQP